MIYILPYLFTLLYWVLFFIFTGFPETALYVFFGLLLLVSIFFLIMSGKSFFKHWNVFICYLIFFISSFGFILISTSPTVRNFHILFFGILGGLAFYSLQKFFRNKNIFLAKNYLHFVSFLYIIAFWQSAAFLYFFQITYTAPPSQASIILTFLTFLLARGILISHELKKSSDILVLIVLTLTTAEFGYFLTLLPLHYYVLATALGCWFFYIVELVLSGQELHSRRKIFRIYTTTLILGIIILFATATWS